MGIGFSVWRRLDPYRFFSACSVQVSLTIAGSSARSPAESPAESSAESSTESPTRSPAESSRLQAARASPAQILPTMIMLMRYRQLPILFVVKRPFCCISRGSSRSKGRNYVFLLSVSRNIRRPKDFTPRKTNLRRINPENSSQEPSLLKPQPGNPTSLPRLHMRPICHTSQITAGNRQCLGEFGC